MEVILPEDARYARHRHTYTARGAPATILLPEKDEEVSAALEQAAMQPGAISIRSGGHGISSVSTNEGGTVISLARLQAVEVIDPALGLVRLGAGAHWGEVAAALAPHNLAISSGDSGDVGVGGLVTAGGIGLMARQYGLTIDRVVAASIVTADGKLRRASATSEPDLFWAVRGAGANFGIVTAVEVTAAVVPSVAHTVLVYEVGDVSAFLVRWGELVETAPRELTPFLYLLRQPGGRVIVQATFVDCGPHAAPLDGFLTLGRLLGHRSQRVSYAEVMPRSGQPHAGQQEASSRSGLARHMDHCLAQALEGLLQSGAADMLQVRSVGGAVNDLAAEATAYAHRHQNFHLAAISGGQISKLDEAWVPLRPLLDGLYPSFQTAPSADDLSRAFPQPTLQRLRQLKSKWDPGGLFRQNFDLTPPAAS
jgi:hypothetical protein